MKTILIDGNAYPTRQALHKALAMMLQLPAYYGGNADALYDCLSETAQPVNVWVLSGGEGEVALALEACLQVFADLGGVVKQL